MKKVLSLFDHHSSKRKSRVECLDEPQTKRIHSSHLVRIICVILAVLCIFAAIIGVVLPGIPTFDFLFLATFLPQEAQRDYIVGFIKTVICVF